MDMHSPHWLNRTHEIRINLALFFLLLLGILMGCASGPTVATNYNASEDVTTYRSSTTISGLQLGGGYGSTTRVRLRAMASCPGSDCTPQEVALVFLISGSSEMRMENRTVELQVNGAEFRSTTGRENIAHTIHEVDQVSGHIASLTLSLEEFQHFAEAEEVTGELGSSNFRLSFDRRSSFRAFVDRVKDERSEDSSSENDPTESSR